MKSTTFPAIAAAAFLLPFATSFKSPAATSPAPQPTAVHCQVPCGIYGDKLRIDMLMEDTATIEKGMKMLNEMEADKALNKNQTVRWVMAKDEHAQSIQDTVAAYWLAQRIKAPADRSDSVVLEKYHTQLELLHGITVAAMKCKQTTDASHVASLRAHAMKFAETYFSAEDMEHIKGHHSGEHR